MRRTLIVAFGSLALTLAAEVAHADYCLTLQGGEVLVLKKMVKPLADTCVALEAFFQGGAAFSVVSGTACTSADGGTMSLTWVTSQGQTAHIANAQIALATGGGLGAVSFGTANFILLAPGAIPGSTLNYTVAATTCPSQPVP